MVYFQADELEDYITNGTGYTGIEITTELGCESKQVLLLEGADVVDVTKPFYLDITDNGLYLTSEAFSLPEYVDGIYKVSVKLHKTNGYVIFQNCSFIDIKYKCRVASLINSLLEEQEQRSEPKSTIVHIMHYALVNGSNCGCNCAELCDVFDALTDLLDEVTDNIENCEC